MRYPCALLCSASKDNSENPQHSCCKCDCSIGPTNRVTRLQPKQEHQYAGHYQRKERVIPKAARLGRRNHRSKYSSCVYEREARHLCPSTATCPVTRLTRSWQDLLRLSLVVTSKLFQFGQILWLVESSPRDAAVRIRNHPGARQDRGSKDGLTPLERDFGACSHDGYPHQEQKQSELNGRQRDCQPCPEPDERREACGDEGTAREICPE
jgi:hypothetical protein